jgi:hypothetical protein
LTVYFLCCHANDSLVAAGTKVYRTVVWQWTSILNAWGTCSSRAAQQLTVPAGCHVTSQQFFAEELTSLYGVDLPVTVRTSVDERGNLMYRIKSRHFFTLDKCTHYRGESGSCGSTEK